MLVCGDNGPEPGDGASGPFRGFKTQLYEGGVRSSLVVWGGALLGARAAGRVDRRWVFLAIDLAPTLLALVRAPPAPDGSRLDGDVHIEMTW